MKTIAYDEEQYPFAELVGRALNLRRLEEAHLLLEDVPLLVRETDQRTVLHRLFYADAETLLPLYRDFVRKVIAPHLPGEGALVYQQVPTFRVQLPGNVAVGEFHKDADYGHQAGEWSFWLPLTPVAAASSVHVESEPDKGDYAPYPVQPGEALMFAAATLRHGNVANATGRTRVSFDFRCLRESAYDPEHVGRSVNTGVAFRVGGYFGRMEA